MIFLTIIHIKKKAQLARKKTCTNGKRRNEKKVVDDKHKLIRGEDHRGLEGLECEPISL